MKWGARTHLSRALWSLFHRSARDSETRCSEHPAPDWPHESRESPLRRSSKSDHSLLKSKIKTWNCTIRVRLYSCWCEITHSLWRGAPWVWMILTHYHVLGYIYSVYIYAPASSFGKGSGERNDKTNSSKPHPEKHWTLRCSNIWSQMTPWEPPNSLRCVFVLLNSQHFI